MTGSSLTWVPLGTPAAADASDPGTPGPPDPVEVTVAASDTTRRVLLAAGAARPVTMTPRSARLTGYRLIHAAAGGAGDIDPLTITAEDAAVRRLPAGASWPGDWTAFLQDLQNIERRYFTQDRDALPACGVPFMPYPLEDFTALLTVAVMHATGRRFLDVGAGPGTKMRLAEALFALDVAGVDVLQELVDEANRGRGYPAAARGDVRDYDRYGRHDIVYVNRPVDGDAQPGFERHLMDSIRPGAVLIHVNGHIDPHRDLGWGIISAEEGSRGPVCGVWRKPAT